MSSEDRWGHKVEMTMKKYFDTPLTLPHKGIILLVRELEKVLGKEEAHKRVVEIFEKEYVKSFKENAEKNPISSFQEWVQRHDDGTSLWTHANIDEPAVVTENRRLCNTVGCLWADTWRGWGAEDIGYLVCCAADFANVKAQHPYLRLERTKTLMQGDDCCDFKFIWEENTI